ncbi:hypothetical protein D3C75_899270 [compost metagenome]
MLVKQMSGQKRAQNVAHAGEGGVESGGVTLAVPRRIGNHGADGWPQKSIKSKKQGGYRQQITQIHFVKHQQQRETRNSQGQTDQVHFAEPFDKPVQQPNLHNDSDDRSHRYNNGDFACRKPVLLLYKQGIHRFIVDQSEGHDENEQQIAEIRRPERICTQKRFYTSCSINGIIFYILFHYCKERFP